MFSPSQEKIVIGRRGKKYHLDIVGVSSTKRRGSVIRDVPIPKFLQMSILVKLLILIICIHHTLKA